MTQWDTKIQPIPVVWDMETHDPDDFLTLLLLVGHPAVHVKAVTITPGTAAQVGLVRWALRELGAEDTIEVGAGHLDHPKDCVSHWHYKVYGKIAASRNAAPADDVLVRHCDDATTLITGAPLKNLGAAMRHSSFHVGRWVAQGGFAGEGVIPRSRQLKKFQGRVTCPTFNLNGAPKAALRALTHDGINARYFVSKNVCHGVVYDRIMHARLRHLQGQSKAMDMILHGMDIYLAKRGGARRNAAIEAGPVRWVGPDGHVVSPCPLSEARAKASALGLDLVEVARDSRPPTCKALPPANDGFGKKLHDPLAACCAIDPDIATWAEVELFRKRGEWGARHATDTHTWIITDYDHERFMACMEACGTSG